jgi:hypothetical protein
VAQKITSELSVLNFALKCKNFRTGKENKNNQNLKDNYSLPGVFSMRIIRQRFFVAMVGDAAASIV